VSEVGHLAANECHEIRVSMCLVLHPLGKFLDIRYVPPEHSSGILQSFRWREGFQMYLVIEANRRFREAPDIRKVIQGRREADAAIDTVYSE
jgi:hypothetical protein